MKLFKAFAAGLVFPSIVLPFMMLFAVTTGRAQLLTIPFIHLLPLIWGAWNALYFAGLHRVLPGSRDVRWLLAGALLGLLIVLYGVFGLDLPSQIGLPTELHYLPFLVGPVLYAILWRYVVKPLSESFGLNEG